MFQKRWQSLMSVTWYRYSHHTLRIWPKVCGALSSHNISNETIGEEQKEFKLINLLWDKEAVEVSTGDVVSRTGMSEQASSSVLNWFHWKSLEEHWRQRFQQQAGRGTDRFLKRRKAVLVRLLLKITSACVGMDTEWTCWEWGRSCLWFWQKLEKVTLHWVSWSGWSALRLMMVLYGF